MKVCQNMQRVASKIRECKGVLASDSRSAPAHMLLGQDYLAQGSIAILAEAKRSCGRRSISTSACCGRTRYFRGYGPELRLLARSPPVFAERDGSGNPVPGHRSEIRSRRRRGCAFRRRK